MDSLREPRIPAVCVAGAWLRVERNSYYLEGRREGRTAIPRGCGVLCADTGQLQLASHEGGAQSSFEYSQGHMVSCGQQCLWPPGP